MKKDLKIFFRAHPETIQGDLDNLKNKSDLVLWIHGGKFSSEATRLLANKATKAHLDSALDLGQKTRIEKIHDAAPIGSSGPGKVVAPGSTILLTDGPSFEKSLASYINSYPEAIIAQVNTLPKRETDLGTETHIHFGEGEVICVIDQERSLDGSHIFLTVIETKLGKVFSDHGVVGGNYSLEESRDSILSNKDIESLKQNRDSKIKYLILSFVTTKEGLIRAFKTIDQLWPGWRQKEDSRIIVKLETASAVENIEDILSLDDGKMLYLVGLGDLGVAVNYKKWELESTLDRLLTTLDKSKKSVIIATGICLSILPPDSFKVLEWSKEKLAWLKKILSHHPSVFAIGTTSESIRASQREVLGEFLDKVRTFK